MFQRKNSYAIGSTIDFDLFPGVFPKTKRYEWGKTETGYGLGVEVPGCQDVEVSILNKEIVKILAKSEKYNKSLHFELYLPEDADERTLTAFLEDGILVLSIARLEVNSKVRVIEVKTNTR